MSAESSLSAKPALNAVAVAAAAVEGSKFSGVAPEDAAFTKGRRGKPPSSRDPGHLHRLETVSEAAALAAASAAVPDSTSGSATPSALVS